LRFLELVVVKTAFGKNQVLSTEMWQLQPALVLGQESLKELA
jgi:hypothetical protein